MSYVVEQPRNPRLDNYSMDQIMFFFSHTPYLTDQFSRPSFSSFSPFPMAISVPYIIMVSIKIYTRTNFHRNLCHSRVFASINLCVFFHKKTMSSFPPIFALSNLLEHFRFWYDNYNFFKKLYYLHVFLLPILNKFSETFFPSHDVAAAWKQWLEKRNFVFFA